MGFFFRKSIGRGPFRINLSKRGIGFSVGVRGLRIGRSSTGRTYTRASIPGTGVGWQSSGKGKSGCLVPLALVLARSARWARLERSSPGLPEQPRERPSGILAN
jgi:hypothetical protein